MVINKNKENNVLIFSTLTHLIIEGAVELELKHNTTSEKINYSLLPIEITQRFISINSEALNDLECGMYTYMLKYGDKVITSGIIRVVDDKENGVITPSPSEGEVERVVYYNG